ncbi:cytochrome P450 [Trichoderma reesei QM6a]|uniref:Cytochrome P450 n=2 Tax=Hypocrea jecorina TaxID=51453 RepID=G0RMP4_HYPJQ|nr:cytochrome P450 [Trichoderma reesei QM6a]EGR47512.1 cytochrome P450 [Trichoderma reesei QM6a]ETS00941.1 putative cytochrome P450 [Trichoderma reesei RUT C-30]
MAVSYPLLAASAVGVATHLLYFKKGEHHVAPQRYVIALATSLITGVILTGSSIFNEKPGVQAGWTSAISSSIQIHTCFLFGLYSSLITYRLFFHPLNKFPGPLGARISTFWLTYRVRGLDAWRQVAALHEQYGPFVRIAPSELSIRNPRAVAALHGPASRCEKGPIYDVTKPMTSLHMFRDRAIHNDLRRVWSQAFSDRALRGYNQRMSAYRSVLLGRIHAAKGESMDMAKWFRFYGFDVMGDLAFGKSFNMLETSRNHWAIDLLDAGILPLALQLPVWLLRFGMNMPVISRDWWTFIGFCRDRLQSRMRSEPDVPDIMSTLLGPLKGRDVTQEEFDLLIGDAQLVIAAGSHTTAASMASIVYELAKHPEHIDKLRNELAPLVRDSNLDPSPDELAHLEHLNAVINETLRLHPPVPTTIWRVTPPGGVMIGDVHVPGGMNVTCPQYAVGRSEAVYSKADSFAPERWYQFPEMIKDKDAFAPFSMGPFGCIGKRLALMDIRQVISRLVWAFDVAFAPGEDGTSFEGDALDAFMVTYGALRLTCKAREGV